MTSTTLVPQHDGFVALQPLKICWWKYSEGVIVQLGCVADDWDWDHWLCLVGAPGKHY